MEHRLPLRSVATIAIALLAGALFADWLAGRATFFPGDARDLPLLAFLMTRAGDPVTSPASHTLFAIVAAAAIAACALAVVLVWKSRTESAARLASALALISLAVFYFILALAHLPYRDWMGDVGDRWWRFAVDLAGYLVFAAGLWQMGRFFEIYPRPIAPDDWAAFRATERERMLAAARKSLFARAYEGRASTRVVDGYGFGIDRWEGARGSLFMAAILGASAVLAATADIFRRGSTPSGPGTQDWGALPFVIGWSLAVVGFISAMIRSYQLMRYHQARGLPDDRTRIEWIYSTTLVGGIVALALPVLGLLLFTVVVTTAREASANFPTHLLMLYPYALSLPVFAISFLVAVSLSIFYRGAVDPRLAARKVTVWWLLGVGIAILFVLLERAVAVRVVHWLGWPNETGYVLAGALVAGTIAPIRQRAETSVTQLVSRWLPVEKLMDGERRRVVVAMCDLSGYTALSVREEKQALLIAALLHRNAALISQAHGGRLVKSIGDAVMLEFPDADGAARALARLHAEFPPACRAMGFDPLPVHSGAHLGEVVVAHDGDLFGQTVNLAARLQGEAQSGQIVVSDAFIAGRATPAPHAHRALGPRQLKNIPEAVDCHELLQSG